MNQEQQENKVEEELMNESVETIEMEAAKHLDVQPSNVSAPDLEKPYAVRNFFKEVKRISWPTKAKNHRYLLWMFLFITFLIAFFALVSLGATEIIKTIGAN